LLLLIAVAEINNYGKFNVGFLDKVHSQMAALLKGRGAQSSFKPACDSSAAEQREITTEALSEQAHLLEEVGELAEAEKIRQRISRIEAAAANCP
jgi:hypothetical protein